MGVRRISLSMTGELAAALDRIAADRDESRSSVVEMLLREHALVASAVDLVRQEGTGGTPPRRRDDGPTAAVDASVRLD